MTKVQPEFLLDVSQLPKTVIALPTDSSVQPTTPVPRQLPQEIADFKVYIDSKCCYRSAPLEKAELVRTDAKVAYKYTMKTLMEVRSEHWKKEPATWNHETIMTSTTLGKLRANIVEERKFIATRLYP